MVETKRITIAAPTAILGAFADQGTSSLTGRIFTAWHIAYRSMIITGENMIIYRRRYNWPFGTALQLPMYQYYLLGKNVTINESKIYSDHGTKSYTQDHGDYIGFYRSMREGTGSQSALTELKNIVLISPEHFSQAFYDTLMTIEDTHPSSISSQAKISLELPRDYQVEISPTFDGASNKGCIYGYSQNLFGTSSNINLNSIPFAGIFAYYNYRNQVYYSDLTNPITLQTFNMPYYHRGFTNAGYPSAYGNLMDKTGTSHFLIAPENQSGIVNSINLWDIWYNTLEPQMIDGTDTSNFGAAYQSSQGLPGTPNPWYDPRRYTLSLNGYVNRGWGPVFPYNETVNNSVPFENIYITNIPISETINEIENYVRDGGSLPSDAYENEVDDDGVPTKFSDDPDDQDDNPASEDGSKTVVIDDMDLPTPTKGAITSGSNGYFLITESSMQSFLHWFWYDNDNWTLAINNWITGMYGNLKECIVSYMSIHCPTGALGTRSTNPEEVILGKLDTNIELYKLIELGSSQLAGEIDISKAYKHYNTFVDYEGYTNFQLYLPYVGFMTLPTNSVQNRILRVYYAVDAATGQMIYVVKAYEPENDDSGFVVFETSVQVGEIIPISLVDSLENATRLIDVAFKTTTSLISIGGNLAAGNAIGAAMSATTVSSNITGSTNNFNNTSSHISGNLSSNANVNVSPTQALQELSQYKSDTPTSIGQVNNVSGKWSPLYCYLLVDYPVVNNKSGGYNRHIGYLLNKPYKLSSLSGFTTCIKPQINFTRSAPLLKEIEEIYQLLESGIIL